MHHLIKDHNASREGKSLGTAYILGLSPLGIFGAYHYYLGNVKLGLIYTFTFGIFGIGWIVDLFRMPKLVRKAGLDKKSVGTAYIMAFPPFGLFGAYHYYLGNYGLGILYTCTLGIFGIGWIVDLFRMKGLVEAANDSTSDHGMTKITAYTICVSPLGIFGAHHFYLERYLNGGFYIATIGLFGFGWIFDILRLPVLYQRYAEEDKHKYADEAYIFWFPFGLFGLHHFYLERKRWGILYACTLGCFGFGWIIDGFRLPSLIKDYNANVQDPDLVPFRICKPKCSMYKCQRCCMDTFSACECFENFSLVRTRSESRSSSSAPRSNGHARDDFDVINEMYPNEQFELNDPIEQNKVNQNQMNIATVGMSYDANQVDYNHASNKIENYQNDYVANSANTVDVQYDTDAPMEYNAYPVPNENDNNQSNQNLQDNLAHSNDEIRNIDDVGVTVHYDNTNSNDLSDNNEYDHTTTYSHYKVDYSYSENSYDHLPSNNPENIEGQNQPHYDVDAIGYVHLPGQGQYNNSQGQTE